MILLGATLVALGIRASPHFSHIDEVQHFDYLEKAARGELVRRGDRIGDASMREMACRGIDVDARVYQNLYGQPKALPPCDAASLDPENFPERGYNTAYIHPPVYYVVTGFLARAVRAVTPIGGLFTAARAVGVLWLALTVLLLWRLLSSFDVSLRWKIVLSVVVISSPGVLSRVVNVNPDATAVMAGAAVALGAVSWERRASPWWVPVGAAALAVALKETNVVGVALATLYLGFRGFQAFRSHDAAHAKRCAATLSAMLLGGALAGTAWLITIDRTARIPLDEVPQLQRLQVDHLAARDALGQAGSNLFLLEPRQPPSFPTSGVADVTAGIANWLLVGAAIACVSLAASSPSLRSMSGAALITLVVSGPMLVVLYYVWGGFFLEIPSRYGLSALAGLLPAAALVIPRPVEWAVTGFAIFFVGVMFLTLIA